MLLRSLEIGGGIVNTVRLAVELHRRGHNVCVVSDEGVLAADLHEAGVPVVFLPLDRKGLRPSPNIVRDLARVARKHRADCIFNGEISSETVIEAPLVSLWTGAPLLQAHYLNWLSPLYLPRLGPMLVTKPYMVDDLVDLGWPRESVILWEARIPLGIVVDPERVRAFRSAAGAGPEHFLAVTVCRLDWTANQQWLRFLLDAVRTLYGEDPESPLRLALVGDGPGRDEIMSHARRLGLIETDRAPVRFLGAMADPHPAYAGCDLFIGRGSSILRAMSMAVPSIALGTHYSRPVAREFFEELTYHEFTRNLPCDPGALLALVALLRRLMSDPDLRGRMAREGRELVAERYDLARGAGQIEGWLRDLVRRPRPVSRARVCLEVAHALADQVWYRIRRRFGYHLPALPSRQGLPFPQ
ncbi:MAG: glycosyltransferase [Planctomycetes bacterium]|nr:glycosyltransferase [Planctomycetota bacterium]